MIILKYPTLASFSDTTPNDLVVRCRVFSISTSVKDFEEASVKSISIHPGNDNIVSDLKNLLQSSFVGI